jgi:MFS family permease
MQNSEKPKFTRRSLILPVYLPALMLAFGSGVVAPTLPLYIKSFNLSYTVTTLVIAISVVGNIPAGILVERMGRKPSMVVGSIMVALATLGVGFANHLFELILYQLIGGIGGALWTISRHAYMTDVIPVFARGRSIALFGGVGRIGSFAGQFVAIFLGANLRLPFFVYAAFAGLTSLLCIIFVAETKRSETQARAPLHLKQLLTPLKTHFRILATAGIGQICVQTLRRGRGVIVPLYGSDVVGLDAQGVRLVVMISSAVDMSMFPIAGFVMDRFGRRYAMIPCFFIFATGMLLMPFTHSFLPLLLTTIVMGLGNGLGSGTMMTLGADLAPRDATGEFLGAWRLAGDFGGAAGPLVVGNIADLWGLGIAGFAVAGIGYAAVLIFLRLVPETLRRGE